MAASKRKRAPDEAPAPQDHQGDPILSIAEVARQLGKNYKTVHGWVRDGLLESIRMPSGLWGIRQSTVNRLLSGSSIEKRVEGN